MELSHYVKRRNGVPLGSSNSLRNMFSRALGAGTFSVFWHYWNPIWGFYLGKYIFKPLKRVLPPALSVIFTFVVCGFIHDLVTMLLRWQFTLRFTLWFFFMGFIVILSDSAKIDYSKFPWIMRALINIIIITVCLLVAYQVPF